MSVAWLTGAQLMIFFCFRLPVVLFGRQGIRVLIFEFCHQVLIRLPKHHLSEIRIVPALY